MNNLSNISKERRWQLRNPEKARAQNAIASKRKELLKEECGVCGSTEKLELHHPDYSKPLYVRTLCRKCHVLTRTNRYEKKELNLKPLILYNRNYCR